jgi:hypothetical protein
MHFKIITIKNGEFELEKNNMFDLDVQVSSNLEEQGGVEPRSGIICTPGTCQTICRITENWCSLKC